MIHSFPEAICDPPGPACRHAHHLADWCWYYRIIGTS
jgi:hypothetical protein